MKLTLSTALQAGAQLLHLPRRRRRVTPGNSGNSVTFEFPTAGKQDLAELDRWLTDHPRCQCIVVKHGTIGFRDYRTLMRMKDKHGVLVSLPPSIRKSDLM